MSERATVDYWRDAKVGDLVWFRDGNSRHHPITREYRGTGFFFLKPVVQIARKYITVGLYDFDKETGSPRIVGGFQPPQDIYGELEKWVEENKAEIHERMSTRDHSMLLRVAKALGMETPVPLETAELEWNR